MSSPIALRVVDGLIEDIAERVVDGLVLDHAGTGRHDEWWEAQQEQLEAELRGVVAEQRALIRQRFREEFSGEDR